jgi:hypothetical protein
MDKATETFRKVIWQHAFGAAFVVLSRRFRLCLRITLNQQSH